MDSIEVTKFSTAVLVAGIAFFISGWIGASIVHPEKPAKAVIEIKGAAPEAAATAAKPEEKLAPIGPLLAAADPAAGAAYFKQVCSVCHTADQGGKAGVGPNLYNVVGGPHDHMEGFNYSPALKAKTGPWTFDALNEWLHKPSAYAPGTRMTFAGIANDKTRANVLAYLRSLSPNPVPLPSATPAAAPAPAPAGGTAPAPAPAKTPAPAAGQAPAPTGGQAPAPNAGQAPTPAAGQAPAPAAQPATPPAPK
jgi:cytochrome c